MLSQTGACPSSVEFSDALQHFLLLLDVQGWINYCETLVSTSIDVNQLRNYKLKIRDQKHLLENNTNILDPFKQWTEKFIKMIKMISESFLFKSRILHDTFMIDL